MRSVDWIYPYIAGAPAWGDNQYVTLDKTFYNFPFKQEAVEAHSYCHMFFLIAFLEEGKKVKVNLVQALRLCTGRTAHRGRRSIALLFLD